MNTLGKRIMAELLDNNLIDVFKFNENYVMAHIRIEYYQGEYYELLNDLLVKNCSENRSCFLVKKEIYEEAKQIVLSGQFSYA